MKYPTLILLISISLCTYGQVESVELLPELINDSTTNILSPSMNGLENRLCYKKTLGTKDAIMISDKNADGKWSEPYIAIQCGIKLTEEVYIFQFTSENKICFYASGSSPSDWGNYYGRPDKDGLLIGTKIDFKDGYIMWVNKDYTTGLVIMATQPTKIATIKFTKSFTDQLLNLK